MDKLAIASVPIQEWEKPYDMEKGFQYGNIFPALHKPFYIEEEMKQVKKKPADECEAKLLEIQQLAFFLTDITLFLDTHENHPQAEQTRQELLQELRKLKDEFALSYYPLTLECPGNRENMRIPWEGGQMHVAF